LAAQQLPDGALEVVVADPGSPDGVASYLEDFAAHQTRLRVVHLPLNPRYHRNRGVGINRAFDVSSGQVVIGIDGDMVFSPTLIGDLEGQVLRDPRYVYGIRRRVVGRGNTEAILRGELDPIAKFEVLSKSESDGEENPFVGVLGYCQAVHRSAFARARYPEEFDMVNQSDIVFVERLGREAGVQPRFLEDLTALHLWHPRNWAGTQDLL
jgi:glycosyltransferase involved in cell wall biosynthesis